MRRFKMLVFSEPFEGGEDAFNKWYSGRHLQDICALPGYTGAQRFKLHGVSRGTALNKYLAIYDIEADDLDWVVENMMSKRGTDEMPVDPSLNVEATTVMYYEEFGEPVLAQE
jgi:uncharacterized protein YheU (UPF0270 family)